MIFQSQQDEAAETCAIGVLGFDHVLYMSMELLNCILRFLVSKLRVRDRWGRFGVVGNTLIFICLCSGVFSLVFAAFGLPLAKFQGEAAVDWAIDGALVGLAASIVLLLSFAFVEFD